MGSFTTRRIDDRTVEVDHVDGHRLRFGWARYDGSWVLEQTPPEWNLKCMPMNEDDVIDAAREVARTELGEP